MTMSVNGAISVVGEREDNYRMTEKWKEDDNLGCEERKKDDKMMNECQDERGGERGKDDNMGCDVHYDQGGGGQSVRKEEA